MAPVILFTLLALPFIEIAVFIKVGALIGVWPTIGLTLLSSAVGLSLMRRQGLATLARARETVARHEHPVDEMLDGLCILLAGALLLVPGFVTDLLGLLLFVPAVRRQVRRWLWGTLARREGSVRTTVIETEYTVVDDTRRNDARPRPPRRLETDNRGRDKGGNA